MSKQIELGTLAIVVLKARNLHDKHSFYKQDVYAQLSLNGTIQNTQVDIKGGQHPVWDAEIRLPVLKDSGEKYRTLEVSCWAKENREDDLKGTGKVDISETLRTGEFDDWVGLETNGTHRGEVYLEITYYAAAPAPLIRRPSKLERVAQLPPLTTPASLSPSRRPTAGQGLSTAPGGAHLLPPSPVSAHPSSPSTSAWGRDHLLPTLPEEPPPETLPKSVPSILRPGHPQSSPTPISRPLPSGHMHYPSNALPPDYNTPYPNRGNSGYSLTPRPAASVPELWRTPPTTVPSDQFSFPVPTSPRAVHDPSGYNAGYGPLPPPVGQQSDTRLPDPYVKSRYTAPLPLPGTPSRTGYVPAENNGPSHHQLTSDNQNERRRRVLLAQEEEAARRKAQEDRDLELARQLDRELNSGGLELERVSERQEGHGHGGMPGGW